MVRTSQGSRRQADKSRLWLVQTRSSVVPGQQRGDNTETTANLGHVVVGILVGQVARCQEQECQGQGEEHGRQRDGRPKTGDPHDEGENGPGEQEDSQSIVQGVGVAGRCGSVARDNSEAWDQNCSVRQPEGAVGGECGSTKVVPDLELPHAGENLG